MISHINRANIVLDRVCFIHNILYKARLLELKFHQYYYNNFHSLMKIMIIKIYNMLGSWIALSICMNNH